jgi:hypothetical protein
MPAFDVPRLDPAVASVIMVALALLFARAALDKFQDLARFRGILEAYSLLPAALAARVAPLVPLVESSIAAGLLAACIHDALRPAAGVAAAALLGVYGAAIGINLARGRKTLDCGCTAPGEGRPIGFWMVVRNTLLACVAMLAAMPGEGRMLGLIDAPLLVGGLIACAALYATADLLLGKVAPVTATLRRAR